MAGRGALVVEDLRRQRAEFGDLIAELVGTVFGLALALLGITPEVFAAGTDVASSRSLQRPHLDGLKFLDGASVWIARLGSDLAAGAQEPGDEPQ